MTRHSDFLQKLSSSATPPNGRVVPSMDEMITRELTGRCLDEATLKTRKSESFSSSLVTRLIPEFPLEIKPTDLNKRYSDQFRGDTVSEDPPIPQAATSRNLRSKHKPPKALAQKKKRWRSPKPPIIYNTKLKKWNINGFPPQKADRLIEGAITEEFLHPKLLTVRYNSIGALAGTLMNGPVVNSCEQQDVQPSEVARKQTTESCHANLTDEATDDGKTEEDSCSFSGSPRKGAAYDGDSFRDRDYVERKEEKKAQVAEEDQWSAFFNALATAIPSDSVTSDSRFQDIGRGRRWYGYFSTKRLPSEIGQAQWSRKPDIILLDDGDNHVSLLTWSYPKALGELTRSDLKSNTTLILTLSTKAYILFTSQPWRRYVLAFSVAHGELRLHLFDRSGIVVSPPIDFHASVSETCRIIHAFAYGDKSILGFDPTIEISPRLPQEPSPVGVMEIDGTMYDIISVLWRSNGFIGRCTNVFHVRSRDAPHLGTRDLDEYDYAVKDAWIEEGLVDHECSILKHISDVEGVPKLLKAWTVQFSGQDDTTLRHRPSQWDRSLTPRYVTRVHRRLLLTPVGTPLSSFRSQRELLYGLISGLEIHEKLITTKRVLHRDISPNNLIFKHSEHGDRPVLLIDFDYAINIGSTTQYPKGTGTLPFVSMAVLRQATARSEEGKVVHEVVDDLESFFYVFMWICVLHSGPNGAVCTPPEDNTSIVHGWAEAAMTTGGLTHALNAKNAFVHAPNKIIDEQFTPYFQNLKPLAKEWKALVKMEDDRREAPEAQVPPPKPLTHQTVIDLLRRFADDPPLSDLSPQTPPSTPLKRPPPSPSSSVTLAAGKSMKKPRDV